MTVPSTAEEPVYVAIYARKSTDAKLEQKVNSISVQCAAARSYVESQQYLGWRCLDEDFTDNNISGATLDRPALRRIQKLIRNGMVKVVVVNRLDRISRSLPQFMELMAFFEEHGVALVSVTQNINTNTPMGRLMLQVMMSFAEFEREVIRDRVTERIHAARKQGRFTGGRPALGYDIVPEGGELTVNEFEALRVNEIFGLYLQLRSVKAVVLELRRRDWVNKTWVTKAGSVTGGSPFSTATLHNLLTNPIYVGNVKLKGEIFDGLHEGIIKPERFDKVQAVLTSNDLTKGNRNRNSHDALLKGLLRCRACNAAFVHTGSKKKHKYYRYYTCSSKRLNGAHTCPSPSIPAGDIEELVAQQLMAIGHDPELQETVYRQLVETIESRQKKSEQIRRIAEQERSRITRELASAREFEGSDSLIAHLNQKLHEAETTLQDAQNQAVLTVPSKEGVIKAVRHMESLWPSFSAPEKCAFVKALVRSVEYDAEAGSLTLEFNDEGFMPGHNGGEA